MTFTIGLWAAFVSCTQAYAQVDPSSAVLLRSTGKAPDKDDLDSSRYKVRTQPFSPAEDNRRLQSAPQPPTPQTPRVSPKPVSIPEGGRLDTNTETPQSNTPSLPTVSDPDMTEQMQKLLLGGSTSEIQKYRRLLNSSDFRLNIVELSLAPIYIYNDSSSNSWYRNYVSSSPGFYVAADVWITPFFGFHTSYQAGLNSTVKGSPSSGEFIPVDHDWFGAGLRFRKFFGLGSTSPGLIFGIDFSEYQMKVPGDETNRIGVKSSGVRLSVESQIPKSQTYHWLLGFSVLPRADHKEIETGIDAESGTNQESTSVGIWVGGKFVYSRKNQVYWKLSHQVEKNLFEGQTNVNDPITGSTIDGVDVTNSMTLFSIGYIWGN